MKQALRVEVLVASLKTSKHTSANNNVEYALAA